MKKELQKNLVAILIISLSYLVARYSDKLPLVQFKDYIMYVAVFVVLASGIYLVRINSKGLDVKNNTLQVIFFIVGLGLVLYSIYALIMIFAWSNFAGL